MEITGRYGTSLMGSGSLWIALADPDPGKLDSARRDLEDVMHEYKARTGIMLISPELARAALGRVPDDWIRKGIGIERSPSNNLKEEARQILREYLVLRDYVPDQIPPFTLP